MNKHLPPRPHSAVAYGEPLGWNRFDLAIAFLIAAFCALELVYYQRIEGYGSDSSYYVGLAESMLHQHRYVFNFKAHTKFPPGFPVILAMISLVFGSSYVVYARAMAVFGALGLWTSYVLLRRVQGRAAGAAACLLLGSSPFFFQMTTDGVLSDVPFFLSTMLALAVAQRADSAEAPRSRWLWGLLFLLLVVASLMIRAAGVALLGGLLAWLAVSSVVQRQSARSRLRLFLPALVLGMLTQAAWMGWVRRSEVRDWPGEYMNTYWNQMRMKDPHRPELGQASLLVLPKRALENLPAQSAHVSELVTRLSWVDPFAASPLVVAPIVLALAGFWVSIRGYGGSLQDWYLVAYIGLYLLWPFDERARFIFPAFALVWLWLWRGGRWLGEEFRRRRLWLTGWLLLPAAILLLSSGALVAWHPATAGLQAEVSVLFWGAVVVVSAALLWTPLGNWVERPLKSGWIALAGFARVAASFLVGLVVVLGLGMQVQIGWQNLAPDPTHFVHYPSAQASRWIVSHSAPDDVIMAGQDAIVHRLTRRRIVTFPVTSDPKTILAVLQANHVKYLVVILYAGKHVYLLPSEEERLALLSASDPTALSLAERGPNYLILRVQLDGG